MNWPFITLGDSQAPPVIFLHGFLGRGQDWLPAAEQLCADYFCVLPDLPGHGKNLPLQSAPLAFEALSTGLIDLVARVTTAAPVMVGYSMGGRAALHFACTNPERVRGLVLESASPGIRDAAARMNRAALDDARAGRMLDTGLIAWLDKWYAAPLWDSLHAYPQILAELKAVRARNDPAAVAKVIADLSPGRMPDLWNCLPSLSMPALVLAGGLDTKYAALAPEIAGLMPDAVCEVVPGAGHNVHLEQPGQFMDKVRGFLYNLEKDTPGERK